MAPRLELIDLRNAAVTAGEAHVPGAVLALDHLTYASWGRPLTLDQYLLRERRLRARPFALAGLRTWVLRDGDTVLASCETFESRLSLSPGRGAAPRHARAHGIASVFVEERHRGRGHASELLRGVHAELTRMGAAAAYLFSEIGAALYARLGYVARPLALRRFAAVDPTREAPHPEPVPWRFIGPEEIPALLLQRYAQGTGGRSPLWLEATPAQLDWHVERGAFYAELLRGKRPAIVGARAGEAFALWTPELRSDAGGVLRVLMLYPGPRLFPAGARLEPRSPEAADLRSVLHGARAAATALGLGSVELWENPASATYLRGGAPGPASDVPMMLPLQPGLRADDWIDYERCHWL